MKNLKVEMMSLDVLKNVLSRDEMKTVMAGSTGGTVYCDVRTEMPDGTTYFNNGYCGSSSERWCEDHASQICDQHGSWFKCNHDCYYV